VVETKIRFERIGMISMLHFFFEDEVFLAEQQAALLLLLVVCTRFPKGTLFGISPTKGTPWDPQSSALEKGL